jgi:hypothetical protein
MPQFKYEEITKKIIGAAMKVHDGEQIGERRVDFLVEGLISVELKALTDLQAVHFTQARNYLEAYNLEVGLLINFGSISLQFKRLENPKYDPTLTSKKSN